MPRISAEARVHRLTLGSDSHAVRFLLAVAAATHGRLLMVLDWDGGDPKFRQLAPDCRLAQPSSPVEECGLTPVRFNRSVLPKRRD